jgi:hypothetical protein
MKLSNHFRQNILMLQHDMPYIFRDLTFSVLITFPSLSDNEVHGQGSNSFLTFDFVTIY